MFVGYQLHYFRHFSLPVSHDMLGQMEDSSIWKPSAKAVEHMNF